MDNSFYQKINSGGRISPAEALQLFSWNIIELGKTADARRRLVFPKEEVGFIIDRIINFTNICEAECSFCAYHARANLIKSYEMTTEDILKKIETLASESGTQVMLQGGLHPDYHLEHYVNMVRAVKAHFPDIHLHSFSPAEIVNISRKSDVSIDHVVKTLHQAGVDSVPGASDLLVERIRKTVCPNKVTVEQWQKVIFALHRNGMKSSATMTFGMGETNEEKIEHLRIIRDVQDRTGILSAFIPWSFSPANTQLDHIQPATGVEYLKVVAVSRIFLDNIVHIQAGWLTEGLKLAQIALTMGANDMGGILTEEVVVKATGIETRTSSREIIKIIKNAGKIPFQRDSRYRAIRKF